MFFVVFAVHFATLAMIFANDVNPNSMVFTARCEARCLNAKSLCLGKRKVLCEDLIRPCMKACKDTDFLKVKSCKMYCAQFSKDNENRECRSSCKYLIKLYNQGQNAQLLPKNSKAFRPTAIKTKLTKNPLMMEIKWSYNSTQKTLGIVFIVESRHTTENPFPMTPWKFATKTSQTYVKVKPRAATWCEYRVMAVHKDGVSNYSSPSSPIYVMPDRPTRPRDFRVVSMHISKGKASIHVAWRKPEKSAVPIHRYKILWSHRLDKHTKELQSLRVHHQKVKGNIHSYRITGLTPNTTYVLEILAICHVKGKRIRSKRVYLTTRTKEREPEKEIKLKKKGEIIYKKPVKELVKVKPTQQSISTQSINLTRTGNSGSSVVLHLNKSSSRIISHSYWWTGMTTIAITFILQLYV